MQKWEKLQTEVFSEYVDFDMSSLGGEHKKLSSKKICEIWKEGFKNIDVVNHLAGNYIIDIQSSKAFVFSYATATHFKDSATMGKTREFVGSYEIELQMESNGWRITLFKYNLKHAQGNMNLI